MNIIDFINTKTDIVPPIVNLNVSFMEPLDEARTQFRLRFETCAWISEPTINGRNFKEEKALEWIGLYNGNYGVRFSVSWETLNNKINSVYFYSTTSDIEADYRNERFFKKNFAN